MSNKPNLLLIITDQQSFRMMGCAGNEYLRTPALDSIAEHGVRFERAHCTNPVCVPSRFSMMTGRMPSAIGQRANPSRHLDPIPDAFKRDGLGWLLREAGYETAYAGKVHLPQGMSPEEIGFTTICKDERGVLADVTADYVRSEHDRPFALVASFINPHDICHMGIRDFTTTDFDRAIMRNCKTEVATLDEALKRPEGMTEEEFMARRCPPLPPNFEPQEDEPEALYELFEQRPFRRRERQEWSEERWRLHRWAYVRLTEMVDEQIGRLVRAVRESGHGDDTLIIFTSDHGDHDGSHRLEHKTIPYEEACRVPFLVRPPGGMAKGTVDDHLITNGLDILPTLCDYAGARVPDHIRGRSLRPLIDGDAPGDWRDHVWCEFELGFMVRTDGHKYVLYDGGAAREQLYDLVADPHETRNAAHDADQAEALEQHRQLMADESRRWLTGTPLEQFAGGVKAAE